MNDNPYDNGMLRTAHFAGLHFEQGWWFIQVLDTEFIELKPWILLNENDNRAAIAAQTAGSEDDEIQDTQGRNYLVPGEQEQDMVFQIQFGIAPSRMQVYPFFGRDRAPNLVSNAEPGEPQVPFTGFDTPYNNPSEHAELFTVNAQPPLSLQAYNPMDEPEEARLSFGVNKIKYAVVDNEDVMIAMLQGDKQAKLHSMGLGAQRQDRFSAPQWLMNTFGDVVMSTQDLIGQGQGSQIPGTGALS